MGNFIFYEPLWVIFVFNLSETLNKSLHSPFPPADIITSIFAAAFPSSYSFHEFF